MCGLLLLGVRPRREEKEPWRVCGRGGRCGVVAGAESKVRGMGPVMRGGVVMMPRRGEGCDTGGRGG